MTCKRAAIFIFLLIGILSASSATADEIYKWVDADGVIHFTDTKSKIPANYLSDAKKLEFAQDGAVQDEPKNSENLIPIEFGGDESFEGITFGASLSDFLQSEKDAKLLNEGGSGKIYIIGDGARRVGDVRVKLTYSFLDNDFHEVRISYDDSVEKKFIDELTNTLGAPELERFPFVYWIKDAIEMKISKKENTLYIFKKKIRKF